MSRGNTTFYAKAVSATHSIKVRDVFSAVFQKHTRDDLDTAFTAGLKGHIPEGAKMLEVWQKPWIFSRVLLYGLLAWVLVVFLNLGGDLDAITLGAAYIVPAVVVPFVIVVFYWEMNIPRNIPIYDIIKFILFGGIIASIVNGVFSAIFNASEVETASIAGLTEELTKLVIIAFILRRKDRCWGLNGLLIGAAVGAGFAIFETNGYGIVTLIEVGFEESVMEGIKQSISVLNMRGALAICGHVAYSAMYGGTLALAKGRDKLQAKHFVSPFFLITFFSAMLLHALWNADFLMDFLLNHGSYLKNLAGLLYGHNFIGIGLVFTVIEYAIIFWVLKLSLRQVVQNATQAKMEDLEQPGGYADFGNAAQAFDPNSGYPIEPMYVRNGQNKNPAVFDQQAGYPAEPLQSGVQSPAAVPSTPMLYLECASGALAGSTFSLLTGESLQIGRLQGNQVKYADDARGISGKHCRVEFTGAQALVTDLGSSYGTYSSAGVKYQANVAIPLYHGESFYLADPQNTFVIHIQ